MTNDTPKPIRTAPVGAKPPSYKMRLFNLISDFEMVLRTVDITQQGLSDRDLFKAAAKTFEMMLNDWQREETRHANALKPVDPNGGE